MPDRTSLLVPLCALLGVHEVSDLDEKLNRYTMVLLVMCMMWSNFSYQPFQPHQVSELSQLTPEDLDRCFVDKDLLWPLQVIQLDSVFSWAVYSVDIFLFM